MEDEIDDSGDYPPVKYEHPSLSANCTLPVIKFPAKKFETSSL